MPLERNTVRSIENFSTGTRGAQSAEQFLCQSEETLVIFLYRQGSKQPFLRRLQDIEPHMNIEGDHITITDDNLLSTLKTYRQVRQEGRLISVPFDTVMEYLFLLLRLDSELTLHHSQVERVYYLACAVSDYYLPLDRMATHKIQSRETNGLHLELTSVPKVLGSLFSASPLKRVVSFKLETDSSLLTTKVVQSFQKYKMHLVVGNILSSIRKQVIMYHNDPEYS